jgi:hypothetical protein
MKQRSLVAPGLLAIVPAATPLPASASTQRPAYLHQRDTFGTGDGQFNMPYCPAVVGCGDVYVSDSVNNRVQVSGPVPTSAKSTTWGRIKGLYR